MLEFNTCVYGVDPKEFSSEKNGKKKKKKRKENLNHRPYHC